MRLLDDPVVRREVVGRVTRQHVACRRVLGNGQREIRRRQHVQDRDRHRGGGRTGVILGVRAAEADGVDTGYGKHDAGRILLKTLRDARARTEVPAVEGGMAFGVVAVSAEIHRVVDRDRHGARRLDDDGGGRLPDRDGSGGIVVAHTCMSQHQQRHEANASEQTP